MIGQPAAELVVVIHLDAGGGEEVLETFEIVVAESRPAMQQQNLDRRMADALGPDMAAAADIDHARAAGLDFGARAGRRKRKRGCQKRPSSDHAVPRRTGSYRFFAIVLHARKHAA